MASDTEHAAAAAGAAAAGVSSMSEARGSLAGSESELHIEVGGKFSEVRLRLSLAVLPPLALIPGDHHQPEWWHRRHGDGDPGGHNPVTRPPA